MGWSDECSVEKAADPHQVYIFVSLESMKNSCQRMFCLRIKSGSISLMVWGCFAGSHLGPLVSFRGINTAVSYITAL